MDVSSSNTKTSHHVRSNSCPFRPHPVAAQVEEQLTKLRSFESTSISSSSICQQLNGLRDLHETIVKFLELPLTQEALSQEQHKKSVDELLDGSLGILDVCNITKDALLLTKESLHEIQSVMRRKVDPTCEVKKYMACRKTLRKSFQRVMKSLKAFDNKTTFSDNTFAILKDVETVTTTVFESLLRFISGSKTQSRSNSKWSMVSKLMNKKHVSFEEEDTEFAKGDAALECLISSKSDNIIQKELQNLEQCIQDLEQGLECLFRCLIKTRVSILNTLA